MGKNFAMIALLLLSLPVSAEKTINFGVYTSDKPTTMVTMFRPILNYIEKNVSVMLEENISINLQVSSTYQAGIDALITGEVDFARMGPASYILSKNIEPNIKLIAMENKKGKRFFYGIICVPKDSRIQNIEQLKGTRFAFGNENSTIGRYLSQHHLYQHGVLSHNLQSFSYLQRHDKVASSVGLGHYDAGALKESTFNKMNKKGFNLREISRFKNTTKPWIASKKIDDDIFYAIKTSLLKLHDPSILKSIKKDGFFEASDSDYKTIRESINKNPLFFSHIEEL